MLNGDVKLEIHTQITKDTLLENKNAAKFDDSGSEMLYKFKFILPAVFQQSDFPEQKQCALCLQPDSEEFGNHPKDIELIIFSKMHMVFVNFN
jgi:hypothetical protein